MQTQTDHPSRSGETGDLGRSGESKAESKVELGAVQSEMKMNVTCASYVRAPASMPVKLTGAKWA